ncbi:YSC84-related protein [Desulfobacterota bacterium M19]
MKKKLSVIVLSAALFYPLFAGAGWNPVQAGSVSPQSSKNSEVARTITIFKNNVPNLKIFFDKAYGYAVFPNVGKGGFYIGGAYGKGEVYRHNKLIGTSSMAQITIGPQIGGQVYSELIFFKDKYALNRFIANGFTFDAQVSAVAVTAGASIDADYNNSVAIFTRAKSGLMFEATVGGQKFTFTPLN